MVGDMTQCNHCSLQDLVEREPGKKFVLLADEGWIGVFEIGRRPIRDQRIREYQGQPVKQRRLFLALTTECAC